MIEKEGGKYIPVCDNCFTTLAEQDTFEEAVEHLHDCGWIAIKDDYGEWCNYCTNCKASKYFWGVKI